MKLTGICSTSVWSFFKRHDITFKKKPAGGGAGARRRGGARRRWMRERGLFDPARLVFIDETAANTKMMRVGGRCVRGERLIGRVPTATGKRSPRGRSALQRNDSAMCD